MSKYFSPTNCSFYDSDIISEASMPADKVLVSPADYDALMTAQAIGDVIYADQNGNPAHRGQSCGTCTSTTHETAVATLNKLGHVKLGTSDVLGTRASWLGVNANGQAGIRQAATTTAGAIKLGTANIIDGNYSGWMGINANGQAGIAPMTETTSGVGRLSYIRQTTPLGVDTHGRITLDGVGKLWATPAANGMYGAVAPTTSINNTSVSMFLTTPTIKTLLAEKADDVDVIHAAGDETIIGTKTFNNLEGIILSIETTSASLTPFGVTYGERTYAWGDWINNETFNLEIDKTVKKNELYNSERINGVFFSQNSTGEKPFTLQANTAQDGASNLAIRFPAGTGKTVAYREDITLPSQATVDVLGTIKLGTEGVLDSDAAMIGVNAAGQAGIAKAAANTYGAVKLAYSTFFTGVESVPVSVDVSGSLCIPTARYDGSSNTAKGAVVLDTLYPITELGTYAGFKNNSPNGRPFIPSATQDRYGVVKIAENLDDTTEGAVPSVAMVKGAVFPDYTSDATVTLSRAQILAGYTLTFDAFVVAKTKKASVKIIVGSAEKVLFGGIDSGGTHSFTFYAKAGSTITVSGQWDDWDYSADVYPLNG